MKRYDLEVVESSLLQVSKRKAWWASAQDAWGKGDWTRWYKGFFPALFLEVLLFDQCYIWTPFSPYRSGIGGVSAMPFFQYGRMPVYTRVCFSAVTVGCECGVLCPGKLPEAGPLPVFLRQSRCSRFMPLQLYWEWIKKASAELIGNGKLGVSECMAKERRPDFTSSSVVAHPNSAAFCYPPPPPILSRATHLSAEWHVLLH